MNQPKIIQIAVSGDEDADALYALCEDGSLWFCVRTYSGQSPWTQLYAPADPMPQPDQPT